MVRAKKKDGSSAAKQMFVQFALEPIWKAYSCCDPGEDVAAILGPIVKGRNLKQASAGKWLCLDCHYQQPVAGRLT